MARHSAEQALDLVRPRILGYTALTGQAYRVAMGSTRRPRTERIDMYTLQIEHGIKDFGMWKAAFDRDPVNRAASGVVAHRISRPVDDPHYVVVELDLASREQAEALLASLQQQVWNSPTVAPALQGAPRTRIVESAG